MIDCFWRAKQKLTDVGFGLNTKNIYLELQLWPCLAVAKPARKKRKARFQTPRLRLRVTGMYSLQDHPFIITR